MFQIFARNITASPTLPENEEVELFRIPMENNLDRPFLSMTLNNELGNAGSFEFSVDPESRFIDIWKHMRTLVRVKYDDETVFFGRVLTIDRDMFRSKKIHCEGAYTFFMDSVFEGKEKGYNIMLYEYLQKLITAHNECMAEAPEKQIFLGEVPGHYSDSITDDQKVQNEKKIFANSKGYKSVKEWLDELISNYAGFMRVRYNDSDGKLYLDWMRNYTSKGAIDQTMSVSSNTVDLSDTMEVDNIFTHVVAMGDGWKYSDGSSGKGNGKYSISIMSSPPGAGIAVANARTANTGDVVTISARAITWPHNNRFLRWSVGGGGITLSSTVSPVATFTMGTANVSITAVFEGRGGEVMGAHSVSVSVTPNGAGNVNVSSRWAVPGDVVTLTAYPTKGYRFLRYSGSGSFIMPDNDVHVTAYFELLRDSDHPDNS